MWCPCSVRVVYGRYFWILYRPELSSVAAIIFPSSKWRSTRHSESNVRFGSFSSRSPNACSGCMVVPSVPRRQRLHGGVGKPDSRRRRSNTGTICCITAFVAVSRVTRRTSTSAFRVHTATAPAFAARPKRTGAAVSRVRLLWLGVTSPRLLQLNMEAAFLVVSLAMLLLRVPLVVPWWRRVLGEALFEVPEKRFCLGCLHPFAVTLTSQAIHRELLRI
mmetsp:Transcript_34328/g.57673  ORF Transcript_34328/g.57673 Transcript_34328/m.57673 type:complete len:219 (-) Transcript_34328:1092-1748(-)